MIRKVRFPLKYKFVVMITALLLTTMGFYLSYALNIFKEDKAADVYSITLTNSVSVAERAKLLINEDQRILDSLKTEMDQSTLSSRVQSLVAGENNFFGLECLLSSGELVSARNDRLIAETNAELSNVIGDSSAKTLLQALPLGETRIETGVVKNIPPHYTILRSLNQGLKCALHVSYEKLMPLMNETLNYGTYLLSGSGKLFLKLNNISGNKDFTSIVKDQTIQDVQQGVKRFRENGENIIRAFAKVPGTGLIAVTEIEEGKAFLASRELIEKSLFFGLLILSVAVIGGILFTRRMTKNVQTLFDATTEMSAGNFEVNPVATGSDEIGALTDSFVLMKDQIIRFMEEMKEKARIEGELQVAHLVQNSFFPKHAVLKSSFNFDGHYRPASECSGDWWGYFEQKGMVTIVACDATGHGVPAALITAAAHSCISTLKIESEQNYVSPKKVLERLNKVVSSMNSDILMTAFCLEIDEEKNEIKYANASHMTPYLLREMAGQYDKSGVVPLQDNNGKRLGEEFNAEYTESSLKVETGDRIVLFSDGLTEMAVDGKAWGQRNFLKALFKAAHLPEAKKFIESVIGDFKEFIQGQPLQDDITLVCVSLNKKNLVLENPEQVKHSEFEAGAVVLTKISNAENITEVLLKTPVNHLIGHNALNLGSELAMVERFEAGEQFNLKNFLNEHYRVKSWNLTSNKSISAITEEVVKFFETDLKAGINLDAVRLVSEELLSNAFYHSAGEGQNIARGTEVTLPKEKEIEFLTAAGSDYLIVSVKGPSAITSREKIVASIERGYREKSPLSGQNGAGLGLYMVYENCSQFWAIRGRPEKSQFICVFEKFDRYKKAQERITSFHYLSKEISE